MDKFKLHNRMARLLVLIAVISSIFYSSFVWMTVVRLENAMLSTLVGHEIDEIILQLREDPGLELPQTASLHAYLLSRDAQHPVPDYLRNMEPNVYRSVSRGDKQYHVAVVDQLEDRIFLSFDITHLQKYANILLAILVGGVLFTALLFIAAGTWLSRRFLLPVSELAEEVSHIDPYQRQVRIEEKYRDYEVGMIAKSIDQLMSRMDDFVEREQLFTSAVSHELRTPVSVIATASELLKLDKDVHDRQQPVIDRIRISATNMSDTIESLLFFAREPQHDRQKIQQPVSLRGLLPGIIHDHELQAREKGIPVELQPGPDLGVKLPANHVSIILGNLIRNAIEYTYNGKVSVSIVADGILVSDTGKGISEHELQHIFDRNFHGADSMGYGIGLHLAMKICKHYGLHLEIESSVGKGTTFYLQIPASLCQQPGLMSTSSDS